MIAFDGAFHGRTLAASASPQDPSVQGRARPFAPEVYRVEFNDVDGKREGFPHAHRSRGGGCRHLRARPRRDGFLVAEPDFVRTLRAQCDEHGIVLIADEVQTGFAQTGRVFAMDHYDAEPDLVTVAKSIAAGLPLSGVVGRAPIMDAPGDGAIGGTYVGNPVAIAAAHAVLDVIEEERLAERGMQIGETIRGRMESWRDRFGAVSDVRGLGAMLAIELTRDGRPDADLATAVAEAAMRRGLLILKARIHGNCIRVLVPLVISEAELEEALGVWEEALEETVA